MVFSSRSSSFVDQQYSQHTKIENAYVKLCLASVQTASTFLLEWTPNLITLYFLGRTGNNDWVTGFGLGILWINCFGMGILNGLACGLETMVSQAFGAAKFQLCGSLFNRGLAIITASMIPIFFLLFFSNYLLSLINSDSQLVDNSAIITRAMIPGVYLNGVYVATKCFLNGQNLYIYQFYTQAISTVSHILWCYIFIERLDLGLYGCAIARTITDLLSLIILLGIIKYTHCSDKVLVAFRKKYFTKWVPFLKVCIPIGSLLWLEWLCYEIYSFQATFLNIDMFGANVIMNNFATLFYQFPYGVSIAATTYVGNEMGKQNSLQAKKFALGAFLLTIVFLLITQTLMYFYTDQIADVFTSDQKVKVQLVNSFIFLQCLTICDGFQAVLTGIVRGIGRENFACFSFLLFYMVIGQIASYVLCFVLKLELNGIWLGMVIGAGGYDLLQILNIILSDWDKLIVYILKNLDAQRNSLVEPLNKTMDIDVDLEPEMDGFIQCIYLIQIPKNRAYRRQVKNDVTQ